MRPANSQYNGFCLAFSEHTCIFDRSSISVLGAPDSQSTHGAIRQFPVTSDEVHFSFTSPKREVLETSVPVLQYSPLLLSPQDLCLKVSLSLSLSLARSRARHCVYSSLRFPNLSSLFLNMCIVCRDVKSVQQKGSLQSGNWRWVKEALFLLMILTWGIEPDTVTV